MDHQQAPLADRVNVEPPIVNGMSHSEVAFTGIGSVCVFVPIGIALSLMTGVWVMLVIFSTIGPLATIWLLSKHLATIKRNKPDGYHLQLLRAHLSRMGLMRSQVITHAGHWQIGRGMNS